MPVNDAARRSTSGGAIATGGVTAQQSATSGADWITIAVIVVAALVIAAGAWAFWRWRQSRWALAQLGLLVQAQIAVNHLFGAPVSLHDVEASGLPFAIALALPSFAGGSWFTSALAWCAER